MARWWFGCGPLGRGGGRGGGLVSKNIPLPKIIAITKGQDNSCTERLFTRPVLPQSFDDIYIAWQPVLGGTYGSNTYESQPLSLSFRSVLLARIWINR